MRVCEIEDCEAERLARGMCRRHYNKWYTYGDPLENRKLHKYDDDAECAAGGCHARPVAGGWCGKHYQRVAKYGSTDNPTRPSKPVVNSDGYVFRYVPGHPQANSAGMAAEHRMVVSDLLGRRLHRHEHVHHKNGLRDDNRPENLELWTTNHPRGVRVEDLVDYCVESLREYAPHLLGAGV